MVCNRAWFIIEHGEGKIYTPVHETGLLWQYIPSSFKFYANCKVCWFHNLYHENTFTNGMRHTTRYYEYISRFYRDFFETGQYCYFILFFNHSFKILFSGWILETQIDVGIINFFTNTQNNICFRFSGVTVKVFLSKRNGWMTLDMQSDRSIEKF